jgi:hypothetical protein
MNLNRFPHALKTPAAKRRNFTSYPKRTTLHFPLNQDNGIMPAEQIQPAKRAEAYRWIQAQPLESRVKVRLWKGWLRTVGQTSTAAEYATLEAGGIER